MNAARALAAYVQWIFDEPGTPTSGACMRFLLLSDERPVNFFASLDDAKRAAADLQHHNSSIRIETYEAPVPSGVWTYDSKERVWVSQQERY